MQEISFDDFIREAEMLAAEWKRFITIVNYHSFRGLRGEELARYMESNGPPYFEIYQDQERWKHIFSPELCDSVRMASAIRVLSQYYTVLPDEQAP